MENISSNFNISFHEIINELLHGESTLDPRYLHRLSDLIKEEVDLLQQIWPKIVEWRRQALLEDLEVLFAEDTLLSFENICRIALEDPTPQIRFLALRSLHEYEVTDLIPTFIQTLNEDEDEEIRALAAINLGKYVYLGEVDSLPRYKQKQIEDALLSVAQGSDSPIVRRKAVESLGYSSHPEIPNLINQAYRSERVEWVASALLAMGRTVDQRWEPEIRAMLDDPNPEIRFEAIRAAGELELQSTRPELIEYLEDSDRDIRMAALWSLSRIGGEDIQHIFEKLLQQAESEADSLIIEEALDHLLFNQGLSALEDLDLFDFDEYEEI